jgi:HEAT repeat protein
LDTSVAFQDNKSIGDPQISLETSAPVSEAPEPMSSRLMTRLFMVPALIVCLLLAVAVVVVLFGSTSLEKQVSTDDLLAQIEADRGERTMSMMLLPHARESWQAAQELARRFEQKEKFLKPAEIAPAADRIVVILNKYEPGRDVDEPGPAQQYFLMMALAKLEAPSGVAPLVKLLRDPNANTRRTALQALGEMRRVPEAKHVVTDVLPLLDDTKPEVRMTACATVACLADPGDAPAIRALSPLLDADREIQWNAAMTLARLGNRKGRLVLMNMLQRTYWEGLDLDYQENGASVRRKYSELEVSRNLVAAIDAARHLNDAEITGLISGLQQDKSVAVRDAARAAVQRVGAEAAAKTTGLGMPVTFGRIGREEAA